MTESILGGAAVSGWGQTPSEALDALLQGPSEQARVLRRQS